MSVKRGLEHMKIVSVVCVSVLLTGMPFATCADPNPGKKADDFNKYRELKLNEEGWQANSDGWVIRVDRNRVFDRFYLTCPVSTEKWPSGVETNDETGLLPFEGARVRTLEIDGRKVTKRLGDIPFETISLKGIQELSQIIIHGPIPKFQENTKWMGLAKDDDWRKSLKRVEFVDHVESMDSIPFLSEVKCIAIGTNTLNGVKNWDSSSLKKCYGIEKLEVPYSLATNVAINWGAIIRGSPLRDCEVVSFEPVSVDDSVRGNVVLLNVASSGEISDCVTEIRFDAIPNSFGNTVYLPFHGKRVIGGRIDEKVVLALKKNALLFYPDISELSSAKRLRRSRSIMRDCPVSVATAYEGLVLSNNVGLVCSDFKPSGYAARQGTLILRRGKNLENKITARIGLGTDFYPVRMSPATGRPVESFDVRFKYDAANVGTIVRIIVVFALVLTIVWIGMMLVLVKSHRFDLGRCAGASIGAVVGVAVFILGMEDVGILQYFVDKYLTGTVMSYLNASFISSLVISVSVTLVKLAIGFLQGISFGAIFANYDLNSLLQPVQDVLDKITTYSWISTCVLAFVRMLCQIMKDLAWFFWGCLGGSIVVYSFMRMLDVIKGRHWVGIIITVSFFLTIGLPLMLCGCSWFSGQLVRIAGEALAEAMYDFSALAHSFSVESLLSLAAIKELMSQFVDAVSNLTSSAMYYIATKAFDCFIVPLFLYFGFKKVAKGLSDNKDEELTRIRRTLDKLGRVAASSASVPVQPMPEIEVGLDNPSGKYDRMVKCEAQVNNGKSSLQGRLERFVRGVKPEWVTACSTAILCLLIALSSLQGNHVVVEVSDAGGGKAISQIATPCGSENIADRGMGGLGWLLIFTFAVVDLLVVGKACQVVVRSVEEGAAKHDRDVALRLLKEDDFYFDLPLYLGLFGTVVGFLVIALNGGGTSGRVVAYFSTVCGILVSVTIHGIVAKYRVALYSNKGVEGAVPPSLHKFVRGTARAANSVPLLLRSMRRLIRRGK